LLQDRVHQVLGEHKPDVLLLSVPFPGAVYAALRIAQTLKAHHPHITVAMGGGFVNTELRRLSEPRVFDFVDFVTLDAGERPLLALLAHLQGQRSAQRLVRTFVREADTAQVRYVNWAEPDVPFEDVGTPTWDGLPLDRYLSLLDMLNPMHRLWSDGRWNKLTVAHGCYWKKCSFCDVSLDYISRYDAASATTLVDRIAQHIGQVVQVQRGQVTRPVLLTQGAKGPGQGVAAFIVHVIRIECGKARAFRQQAASSDAVAQRGIAPLQESDGGRDGAVVALEMVEEKIHAGAARRLGLCPGACLHLQQTVGREQRQHQLERQIVLHRVHPLATQKARQVGGGRVRRVELRHRWDEAQHAHRARGGGEGVQSNSSVPGRGRLASPMRGPQTGK